MLHSAHARKQMIELSICPKLKKFFFSNYFYYFNFDLFIKISIY